MGQKLLGLERQKSERSQELESLEQDLQRSVAKNQTTDAELQYPSASAASAALLLALVF